MKARTHSMTRELSLLIASIIVLALVVIGVMTWLFLEPFYRSDRIRRMKDTYQQLVSLTKSEIDSS